MNKRQLFAAILAGVFGSFSPSTATAVQLYWDTSSQIGFQAGPGTWSTLQTDNASQRWSIDPLSTPAAWTQNSDAVFETDGTSAVTVSGVGTSAINVNSITFTGTGYTISGDVLTLTGPGGPITTSASAIINAPLQGTVGLTKLGSATLTLGSTSNAYSGLTQVSGGTLLVVGSTPAGSAVTVSGGGSVLGGTGTVGGTVSVGAGAAINAGLSGTAGTPSAVGTLITGALTLNGALHTDAFGTSFASWDQIVAPGIFTIGPTATFDVSIATAGLNFTAGTTYILVDASSISGTFTNFAEGTPYTANGYNFTVHYDTGAGNFDLIAVPEPSTWAAGGLTLVAVAFTQRRRLRGIRL